MFSQQNHVTLALPILNPMEITKVQTLGTVQNQLALHVQLCDIAHEEGLTRTCMHVACVTDKCTV